MEIKRGPLKTILFRPTPWTTQKPVKAVFTAKLLRKAHFQNKQLGLILSMASHQMELYPRRARSPMIEFTTVDQARKRGSHVYH